MTQSRDGRRRFGALCDQLDVRRNDLVFLHISYSRVAYLELSPEELVEALLDRLGPEGTLAMPSYAWHVDKAARPWKGYADYFAQRPPFDVRHTPSNMGVVSEQFRHLPGVHRSASYWWSICAKGPLSGELAGDQARVNLPYGQDSSFGRLARADVKVLGLGVSLNTSSLAPIVDYSLGTRHPHAVFTEAPETGVVIDGDGARIDTRSYWLLPEVVRLIKPTELIEASSTLGDAIRRADEGMTIHFSYRFQAYHDEAMRLGDEAVAKGQPVPWLQQYPLKTGGGVASAR
jgi:hypothetical protein